MTRDREAKCDVQSRLEKELGRLQHATGMGSDLSLEWTPKSASVLSGKVEKGIISIYELDEEKAAQTLKHEFLDYLVCQAIEPYKIITNALIKTVNEDAYARKEKIVEALTRLLKNINDDP